MSQYLITIERLDGKKFESWCLEGCLKPILQTIQQQVTEKGSIWEFSDVKIFNEAGDDLSESQWIQEMIMEEEQ